MKTTRELPPLLYITRLDYDRTHAWWVRIPTPKGKPGQLDTSKMFSDGLWGGRAKALVAAQRWRKAALKEFPRPSDHRYRNTIQPGHGYIRFEMRLYHHRNPKKRRTRQPAWTGWLRVETGKAKSSNASIDRWGREQAYQRVEQWLEKERRALAARLGISYAKLLQQASKTPYSPRPR
jgi:hypothetical protein